MFVLFLNGQNNFYRVICNNNLRMLHTTAGRKHSNHTVNSMELMRTARRWRWREINHEFHYSHLKILKLNCATPGEFPSKLVIKALVLHFLYAFCHWKDGLMLIFFAIDATWSENRELHRKMKQKTYKRPSDATASLSVFRGGNWILLVLEPPQPSGFMYPCCYCSGFDCFHSQNRHLPAKISHVLWKTLKSHFICWSGKRCVIPAAKIVCQEKSPTLNHFHEWSRLDSLSLRSTRWACLLC